MLPLVILSDPCAFFSLPFTNLGTGIEADYAENVRLIDAATAPPPDLVEQIAELQRLVADQGARIVELERLVAHGPNPTSGAISRHGAKKPSPTTDTRSSIAEPEDGAPGAPGEWCKAKEAAHRLGYSPSGLRNLAKKGRIVFDVDGGRRIYNISAARSHTSQLSTISLREISLGEGTNFGGATSP
jgi:hypothetical protein